jgi:hypothetical protein
MKKVDLPRLKIFSLYFSKYTLNHVAKSSKQILWIVMGSWHERNGYKILTGKPGRKTLLWKIRHRWKDKINIYLTEIGLMMSGFSWLSV